MYISLFSIEAFSYQFPHFTFAVLNSRYLKALTNGMKLNILDRNLTEYYGNAIICIIYNGVQILPVTIAYKISNVNTELVITSNYKYKNKRSKFLPSCFHKE